MTGGQALSASKPGGRLLFPDVLRIISTFGVMMIHVSAGHWGDYLGIGSPTFNAFTVYNSFFRFSVPVFVMVSGMSFLDPERQVNARYILKKMLRIVAAFVFWSALYGVYETFFRNGSGIDAASLKPYVKNVAYGHYHMWFLYMIAGLYLITPFLRKITEHKRLSQYFLALSFLFGMFLPTIKNALPAFAMLNPILEDLHIDFVLGYSGYYVLGYYLVKYPPAIPARRTIYGLGLLGVMTTIALTVWTSVRDGRANASMLNYFSPAVAVTAAAMFLLIMERFRDKNLSLRFTKWIAVLSRVSFGMYLAHDFFNILFNNLGFTTLSFEPGISPLVITCSVFILSFIASWLIGRIPVLGKYIV